MKNKILNLWCLSCLIIMTALTPAQAIELHIPARPTTCISDNTGYLTPGDLTDLTADIDMRNMVNEKSPLYLLVVPADYAAQMDTFAKLVSHSWDIAEHDQSIILIMTAEDNPKVFVQVARENTLISDTVAAFFGAVLFPKYMKDGAVSAVKAFMSDIDRQATSPGYIQVQYGYSDFSRNYKQNVSFSEHVATGVPTNWTYTIIAILILLVVGYFIYKTFMIGFDPTGSRKFRSKPTPSSKSEYTQKRGVKKVKGATDAAHKRTTPAETQMGTASPHSGHGIGKGLAAGAAGLAAGAALADAMNDGDDSDDGGGDYDDSFFDTGDSSSDYSSDSSSDYSSDSSSDDY